MFSTYSPFFIIKLSFMYFSPGTALGKKGVPSSRHDILLGTLDAGTKKMEKLLLFPHIFTFFPLFQYFLQILPLTRVNTLGSLRTSENIHHLGRRGRHRVLRPRVIIKLLPLTFIKTSTYENLER